MQMARQGGATVERRWIGAISVEALHSNTSGGSEDSDKTDSNPSMYYNAEPGPNRVSNTLSATSLHTEHTH